MRDLIDTGSAFGVFAAFAAAVAWDVPRVGEGAAIVAMVVALAVACAAVVQVYTGRAWWRPSREGLGIVAAVAVLGVVHDGVAHAERR